MNYKIFNNIPDALAILDIKNDEITYVNQQMKQLLEVNGSGLIIDFKKYIHPAHSWDQMKKDICTQLNEKNFYSTDIKIYTEMKKELMVSIKFSYLLKEKGQVVIIFNDITETYYLQREVDLISETIPGGLVIMDLDEYFTMHYINSGYCQLIGYTKEEIWDKFQNRASLIMYLPDLHNAVKELKKQLAVGNQFYLEARLNKKDGTSIWIAFQGRKVERKIGPDKIYCMLTDISQAIEMIEELNSEKKLNQVIRKISGDILFRFNLRTGCVEYSENMSQAFGIPNMKENFMESILESNIIKREDINNVLEMVQLMEKGVKQPVEFRMKNLSGKWKWYCAEYEITFNDELEPVYAVGKITNVDKQKAWEKAAKLDSLTGCYNKKTIEDEIEKIVKESLDTEQHAFIIIDIDNFKDINDNLGHHFGDLVLSELSEQMRGFVGSGDLVGRIGGDEFVVFLKCFSTLDEVERKVINLMTLFRNTFKGESKEYKISASMGISQCPNDGISYKELYQKADIALYTAKRSGKDFYSSYSKDTACCIDHRDKLFENAQRYLSQVLKGEMIYNIFEYLYETKDINATINKILAKLGNDFSVDRCYIFESEKEGELFNNTYEWCNQGIDEQKDSLQNIPKAAFNSILSECNEEGVFYTHDISAMDERTFQILECQGIKSILLCVIREKEVIRAIVGFDDCKYNRMWGGKEIATLIYVSKVLGIYLINKRNSDNLYRLYESRNNMLENMGAFIYVIDLDSYKMVFVNKMVRELIPGVKCGDKCYKIAFGREEGCHNCPAKELIQESRYTTREIYNPNYQLYTLATATKVEWEGVKNAALICCIDITKYKKK